MLLGSVFILQSCSDDDDEETMDRQVFVNEAASANMFEIQSAQLALEKSDNPTIEAYAEHMVTDHSAATLELTAIATTHRLNVPGAMLKKHQDMYNSLAAKSGVDFEKSYASMMVTSHQETIALFENASLHVNEEDLREFAGGKLPTLRHHLEEAQDLNAEINP